MYSINPNQKSSYVSISMKSKNAKCKLRTFCKNSSVILSYDGENFVSAESSKYSHYNTKGLANYLGNVLTTGCYDSKSCYIKTEIMNVTTQQWSDGPDYPFADK